MLAAVVLCAAVFLPAGCERQLIVVAPSPWGGKPQPVEGWAWEQKPLSTSLANNGTQVQTASNGKAPGQNAKFADLMMASSVETVVVPGNCRWVNTGFRLRAGDNITVTATGRVRVFTADRKGTESVSEPGPTGTYLYPDAVVDKPFPLPTAKSGPAPAFCLIGRIDEGMPFYVGAKRSWQVEHDGVLHLGMNDYDPTDNTGSFTAKIARTARIQPVVFEETLHKQPPPGKPQPDCSLVVFYVDGLRPDVVREMAGMGHLPNISRLFLSGGLWMENTFTVFPSNTITANGTMWTGCFSDRHGLKGQVRFSRRSLFSDSYLAPMGPNRAARLLSPQGIDRFVHKSQKAGIRLFKGSKASKAWSRTHVTNVPPLYEHLRRSGGDWATGVLPMMTEVPPILWTRSLVKHLPYLRSQDAWKYIDDANTDYTVKYLLDRQAPVTIVWLPETDSTSHKRSRGQFGMTRRVIARADLLIGRIVQELKVRKRLQKTYLMLVSDHGHHGGRSSYLSHFDIANELFYRPRECTKDGRWIGGGLGLSVRQHRSWNRHPEDKSREFAFIDGDSDGVARIYLPRGHFRSGRWMGKSRPADLIRYRIAKHQPPVNLVDLLTDWKTTDGNGLLRRPIDLVMMKLSDSSLLIATKNRGYTVIDRRRNSQGKWEYRYTPVERIRPTANGAITFDVAIRPQSDPLELLTLASITDLRKYHNEKWWLQLTAGSRYPDSVVALSRHMLWQKTLKHREAEFAPDLIVTARRDWFFGTKHSRGTTHGYPFADSMRASLFITGPNIRRGARMTVPCRLVDLTPTILEMVGRKVDPDEFDGEPLRGIYQSDDTETKTPKVNRPVFWSELDLQAWRPLVDTPIKPYAHQPITVNHPESPFDLNSITHNVLMLGNLNVLRLIDDLVIPRRSRKVGVAESVERAELYVRRSCRRWAVEGISLLDLSGLTIADYSYTSTGNLKRVDGAIDWMQQRGKQLDGKVARKIGRKRIRGTGWVHKGIDGLQAGFWETYRFGQRVIAELLDETILNSVEDGADRVINTLRSQPAEITVDPPHR